ncbi:FAD/NAD(P)-binding domain-containing protein [Suhomyces tanzawaensis NRRL Y-17324]|uniref:FAD/NAD(P)-binding domain-containing protein n=1 Tax=Suhomyces tanzawaensis NRRL Y-17324 TaxID=984487 RepID=A0A1E4SNS7_9ASCO|nr:FAD/NAD(P)-binding domain-containing protein [Suhomyces tanzawaensis NRRL Y-17324]ODV81174.1 FAD/NAD(P)-binding domain-containing protein [Suhomyces tanzawaensis NRRL Y-17324]
MTKEVIIVGGSYSAMYAAKSILLKKHGAKVNLKIISPSQFGYFNIAAPRLLIEPELIDKTLTDIEATIRNLSSASKSDAVFIKGSVDTVDLEKKIVSLADGQKFQYDNLIIATGTKYHQPGLKLDDINDEKYTVQGVRELIASIKKADSIAVIGGGATGVEIAGELGSEYDDKRITLYTGSSNPLSAVKQSIRVDATNKLKSYGVEVINNAKVAKIDSSANKTVITLDDKETREFDLVIPVHSTTPNSLFLKNYKQVLDANGYLIADEYLRLKGYNEVLVIGDVLSGSLRSLVDIVYYQKSVFDKTIDQEIFGVQVKLKSYDNTSAPMLLVPISRNGGVGTAFGFALPNLVVKYKSRDFFISKARQHFT